MTSLPELRRQALSEGTAEAWESYAKACEAALDEALAPGHAELLVEGDRTDTRSMNTAPAHVIGTEAIDYLAGDVITAPVQLVFVRRTNLLYALELHGEHPDYGCAISTTRGALLAALGDRRIPTRMAFGSSFEESTRYVGLWRQGWLDKLPDVHGVRDGHGAALALAGWDAEAFSEAASIPSVPATYE